MLFMKKEFEEKILKMKVHSRIDVQFPRLSHEIIRKDIVGIIFIHYFSYDTYIDTRICCEILFSSVVFVLWLVS